MSGRRRGPAGHRTGPLAAVLVLVAVLAGCTGGGTEEAEPTPAAGQSSAAPVRATPPPRPPVGACYRLDYDAALSPTNRSRPVPCTRPHTATTYAVGSLATVREGHLLAVDSDRVQAQVAQACPERLGGFLGATPAQLRLTSLRPVWFTPTLRQSDAGQSWYRCDVIALAGPERLAPLSGDLERALATPDGRRRYGICGTAQPGTPRFERVICASPHTWRALASYDLPSDSYPDQDQVHRLAEDRCRPAARAVAADTLDYQWGYDWPTREEWRAGQHYGLCWAPG